jgi:hypothetical protein
MVCTQDRALSVSRRVVGRLLARRVAAGWRAAVIGGGSPASGTTLVARRWHHLGGSSRASAMRRRLRPLMSLGTPSTTRPLDLGEADGTQATTSRRTGPGRGTAAVWLPVGWAAALRLLKAASAVQRMPLTTTREAAR